MSVGEFRCVVVNVTDLAVAERFWSEVLGLPVISSNYTRRFSYLGQEDPWKHELILQLVDDPKPDGPNRCHMDITVEDVDRAITQIAELGGAVKKEPSIYPRPGSFPGSPPVIDWAVMTDPFGNEFCLVSPLSDEEARAVEAAIDASTDKGWRAAAGRTSP
jgi:predicted enzyme related to lactoylglutathione lyase